jgi:hypothetical protein
MRSRTKHINLKFHHFREFVAGGLVTVHPINTREQPADVPTKSLWETTRRRFQATSSPFFPIELNGRMRDYVTSVVIVIHV